MTNTIINKIKAKINKRKNNKDISILILSLSISIFLILGVKILFSEVEQLKNLTIWKSNFNIALKFSIQWILIFMPYLIINKTTKSKKNNTFKIKKQKLILTIKDVLKGLIINYGITTLILISIIYLGFKIPGYKAQDETLSTFGTSINNLILAGGIIIILTPIFEEILFRGIILKKITNKFGATSGSAITAFIFAISHLEIEKIIPLFIIGLILNQMTIKRKSITSSLAFHILNNTILFMFQLVFLIQKSTIQNIIG